MWLIERTFRVISLVSLLTMFLYEHAGEGGDSCQALQCPEDHNMTTLVPMANCNYYSMYPVFPPPGNYSREYTWNLYISTRAIKCCTRRPNLVFASFRRVIKDCFQRTQRCSVFLKRGYSCSRPRILIIRRHGVSARNETRHSPT